jgi:hypothetical protein
VTHGGVDSDPLQPRHLLRIPSPDHLFRLRRIGCHKHLRPSPWESFARLVLEAAYEATLLAAVEQAEYK